MSLACEEILPFHPFACIRMARSQKGRKKKKNTGMQLKACRENIINKTIYCHNGNFHCKKNTYVEE
jgi:hypothetical protein